MRCGEAGKHLRHASSQLMALFIRLDYISFVSRTEGKFPESETVYSSNCFALHIINYYILDLVYCFCSDLGFVWYLFVLFFWCVRAMFLCCFLVSLSLLPVLFWQCIMFHCFHLYLSCLLVYIAVSLVLFCPGLPWSPFLPVQSWSGVCSEQSPRSWIFYFCELIFKSTTKPVLNHLVSCSDYWAIHSMSCYCDI